jgi:Spy/CpxP family protein refolding chaperone
MAVLPAITQTGTAPTAPRVHKQQMIRALDLTAAQKQQAKAIRQATRAQAQPLAAQARQQRESLKTAIQAGDTTKIQQISTTIGSLRGQLLGIRSAGKAQFYALLTPEQKTKAAEFGRRAPDAAGGKG